MSTESEKKGIVVLRAILRRMRNEKQGGYHNVGPDGKFVGTFRGSTSLPFAVAEELDALFALAGIVPEPIAVNGDCGDCIYGDARGGDLGWGQPCCSCSRPKMTNFVPLSSLTKTAFGITDTQATLLENVKSGAWWATGIVVAEQFSKEWQRQIALCNRVEAAMKRRVMMAEGMGGRRLTMKGLRALQMHRKKAA